jgi:DNA-binding XRE family transcriptional regulator
VQDEKGWVRLNGESINSLTMTTQSSHIVSLVREIRNGLQLTQVQFSQVLGVLFQSVNCWENGKTKLLPIVFQPIEVIVRHRSDGRKTNSLWHRDFDCLVQSFLRE